MANSLIIKSRMSSTPLNAEVETRVWSVPWSYLMHIQRLMEPACWYSGFHCIDRMGFNLESRDLSVSLCCIQAATRHGLGGTLPPHWIKVNSAVWMLIQLIHRTNCLSCTVETWSTHAQHLRFLRRITFFWSSSACGQLALSVSFAERRPQKDNGFFCWFKCLAFTMDDAERIPF